MVDPEAAVVEEEEEDVAKKVSGRQSAVSGQWLSVDLKSGTFSAWKNLLVKKQYIAYLQETPKKFQFKIYHLSFFI